MKETALYRRGDGLGAPVDSETLEDRAKMPFYAIFADTQYVGDLRARKTIRARPRIWSWRRDRSDPSVCCELGK